jgi:protein SCO1
MASSFWTALATKRSRATNALLPVLFLAGTLLSSCSSEPPLTVYGAIPEFKLTDQTGSEFTSTAHLQNKVWIADFIYTNCPGPCPRMSSQMHQVQNEFAGNDNVRFVSITVDPDRDTPPVLTEYAKHFEADPSKWFFLTGSKDRLQDLSKRVFMLGDVDGTLEHSTRFALVDQNSRIRGYYVSSDKDAIPNLIADTKRLLKSRS